MAKGTITIAFPQGGIVPAAVLNADKDRHVMALESVDVPIDYGQHLINDRFAVAVDASAKPKDSGTGRRASAKVSSVETLVGSNTLPASVALTAEKSVPLGDVVARAHKDSTLSVAAWNALDEEGRDALLAEAVEALKAEA